MAQNLNVNNLEVTGQLLVKGTFQQSPNLPTNQVTTDTMTFEDVYFNGMIKTNKGDGIALNATGYSIRASDIISGSGYMTFGTNKVIVSPSTPSSSVVNSGDVWIRNGGGSCQIKYWSGSAWV